MQCGKNFQRRALTILQSPDNSQMLTGYFVTMRKPLYAMVLLGALAWSQASVTRAADPPPATSSGSVGTTLLTPESPIAGMLQRGLFEEEANLNYTAAAQAYEAVIQDYDKDRKIAATALFRLAECYRKLGRTNDALPLHQRVTSEFPDQNHLVSLSRRALDSLTARRTSATAAVSNSSSGFDDEEEVKNIWSLIQNSPDLLNRPGPGGLTPLQSAALEGKLDVARLLLTNGAAINGVRAGEHTPLHFAVGNGHNAMVQLLLAHGADPNAMANNGVTPLHLAAVKGYELVAKTLLSNRANARASNVVSQPPRSVAVTLGGLSYGIPEPGGTPLHLAVQQGSSNLVRLFIEAGADVDARNPQGQTSLAIAAAGRNPVLVKALLDAKADPNAGKEPPLFKALASVELVDVLLKAGANLNARRANAWTPLHDAALHNLAETVSSLLKQGAEPNTPEVDERTPLHIAADQLAMESMQVLLAHKANPNALDKQGRSPLDYLKRYANTSGYDPVTVAKANSMIQMLRQHGALDDIPRPDRIMVRRPGGPDFTIVTTNSYYPGGGSGFTLMEVMGMHYELLSASPGDDGSRFPFKGKRAVAQAVGTNGYPFPDFRNLRLRRMAEGTNFQTQTVDLLTTNCSGDVTVHWGDVIEVPERPHATTEGWKGLPVSSLGNFIQCLFRKVTLTVHGNASVLELGPKLTEGAGYPPLSLITNEQLWLRPVLMNSGRVLSTSDLTRVKVRRPSENKEWVIDCSAAPGPIFWLRDGDEVEVFEKGTTSANSP